MVPENRDHQTIMVTENRQPGRSPPEFNFKQVFFDLHKRHVQLDAKKVRVSSVDRLDLYLSRAGAGGCPPARLKRVTCMKGLVLKYARF